MRKWFVTLVAALLLAAADVHAQDASSTGNITTAGQTVELELDGFGTAAIQATNTWAATLNFEATVDGTNWFAVNVFRVSDFTAVTTSVANGEWMTGVAGYQKIRVRAQPYTSGTATVTIRAAAQSQPIPVSTSTPSTVTVNNGAGVAAVNVQDGGNSLTVDGPVTDVQLRATPVPVSGTVTTGGLTDAQLRATPVPVSGPLTDTQLRTTPVPVSGTVTATGPLTDTQLRATPVPVSGPLTDTQLRATPVPVSGTVTATGPLTDTQLRATPVPTSLASVPLPTGAATEATLAGVLTDTQLRASPVPVSGPLTDTQLRATPVPVSGTVTATGPLTDTQLRATPVPVSGTVTATGPLTDTQLRATPVPVSPPPDGEDSDTFDSIGDDAVVVVPDGHGSAIVTLVGAWTDLQAFIQGTTDGTNWFPVGAINASNGLPIATGLITQFDLSGSVDSFLLMGIGGLEQVRVILDTVSTGTGTATIRTSAAGPSMVGVTGSVFITNSPISVSGDIQMLDGVGNRLASSIVQPAANARGLTVRMPVPGTPAVTSVNDAATSTTCLAANADRRGAVIYNDSASDLYIKFGATASTTSYTYKVFTDGSLTVPFGYTGIIDCIWSADSTGAARVTEVTQ